VTRFIVTGAPGAGKTSILRQLATTGYTIVPEAATDVIAIEQSRGDDEPWSSPLFIDKVVSLQLNRERAARGQVQLYDRSVLCTLALARYLRHPVTPLLSAQISGISQLYHRDVFFVRPIGFVTPSAGRRISYAEALEFERIHEDVYREHGFRLIEIPPGPVSERAELIERYLRSPSTTQLPPGPRSQST
jgi:predicted ATPase